MHTDNHWDAYIRAATPDDGDGIAAVYNYYIANTVVTFEEQPVSATDMAARVARVTAGYPWLVAEKDREILGYAYATLWHARSAYRMSAETTVYLRHDCTGQRLGLALYRAVIDRLKAMNIHCVIGGIALPNAASVALHEKVGFRKVGEFHEVGWKFGQWIDVGYWEMLLSPA